MRGISGTSSVRPGPGPHILDTLGCSNAGPLGFWGAKAHPPKAYSSWLAGLCPVRSSWCRNRPPVWTRSWFLHPLLQFQVTLCARGAPPKLCQVGSWMPDACSSGCLVRGASPPSCLAQQGSAPISPLGIISTSPAPNCPEGSGLSLQPFA